MAAARSAAALFLLLCLGPVTARHLLANTSYPAAYQFLSCSLGDVEQPANTQEVADLVARLYRRAQAGTHVTLRVSRPHFHSTASFVCPISYEGSLNSSMPNVTSRAPTMEVGLLQTKLNTVLAVDPVNHTMRVGSGMTITELLREATKNGLSLQVGGPRASAAG